MRQGALSRRGHGTGGRRSRSPSSARAPSRSAGGGAHPPRPLQAPARSQTLSARGRASGVLGDSLLGSLRSSDPPKRAAVSTAGSSLAGSWSRWCQAVPAPRSPRLALSRPPPGPRRARAGSCLPETCPAVCACVCLSKSLPLHHSSAQEALGPRRPAAEWLPVHTLPALSPSTPPLLLLALPLLPLLLLQQPLPSSPRQRRNRSERGGEGWERKRRCLQPRWVHTPELLAAREGQALGREGGRRGFA